MTKGKMLDFIESTNMIVDFDRKYLMRKPKTYIEGLYHAAVQFVARKN